MFTREMAIALLQQKQRELGRQPKKEDYAAEEVARIKSKLGPWPRALEAAGLKKRKQVSSSAMQKRKTKRHKEDALEKLQESLTNEREDKNEKENH